MNKNHDKIKSGGSQAEADFLIQEQWYRGGYQPSKRTQEEVQAGTIHDSEEGVNVPEVFRENRERFSSKPEDINAYRRQIKYRCGYIGTKELEIVLSDWLDMNAPNMTYAELEQFDKEVLDIENPQLQRYLMNGEPIEKKHDNHYMNALVDYVEIRKVDYASNVPNHRLIFH